MSSFLEIVELESGEVVLRRVDGKGGPLVTIDFSEETKVFLNNQVIEIGKAMIGAGIGVVGEMYDLYEFDEAGNEVGGRVVH